MALQYNFVFDHAGGLAELNNPTWPQWVVCHERRLSMTVHNCTRDEAGQNRRTAPPLVFYCFSGMRCVFLLDLRHVQQDGLVSRASGGACQLHAFLPEAPILFCRSHTGPAGLGKVSASPYLSPRTEGQYHSLG
jgi:hypothetical protein